MRGALMEKQPVQVGVGKEGRGHKSYPEEVVLDQGPHGWTKVIRASVCAGRSVALDMDVG